MGTENKKISAYLPPHIHEKFKAYENDNKLGSSSKALISIIAQFLGIESSVKTTGVTLNEFQDLKIKVNELEKSFIGTDKKYNFLLSEPIGSLLSKLPEIIRNFDNFIDEFKNLKNKLEKLEYQVNEQQVDQYTNKLNIEELSKDKKEEIVNNDKISLNVKQLAKRLQIDDTGIYRHRKTEKFTEWSRQRDPEGIGWMVLESGEFVPEREMLFLEKTEEKVKQLIGLPSLSEPLSEFKYSTSTDLVSESNIVKEEIKENLSSTLELPSLSRPLNSLVNEILITGYQLARRLKVNKNLPAVKKKSASKDKFYEWSKEKDVDEIGWIPNPSGVTGYVPNDELSSELLQKLQDWIKQDQLIDSGFKAAAVKSKTKRVNINRLLDDKADSLQGDLLIT